MKKLLTIPLLILCILASGQLVFFTDSMPAPTGDDTTWSHLFFTPDPWSIEFNTSELGDATSTLLVASCANIDSNLYYPIWRDSDLNGVNDNPWTLADTILTIWNDNFPHRRILFFWTGNDVEAGQMLYYTITKR